MRRLALVLGFATLGVVALGVLISSRFPDGLERVAAGLGFASRIRNAGLTSPFANYETRFFHSRWPAQASAGLVGAALLYGFGVLFGRTLKRKRQNAPRNTG